MKSILFATTTCLFGYYGHSQSFSYSFSGELDQAKITSLEKKILTIEEVKSTQIKYKSESHRGEIIFYVEENLTRSENPAQFSPVTIKEVILSHGLDPIDIHRIK